MTDHNLFSTEHIELFGMVFIPIGSGILYLIRQSAKSIKTQARIELKVDTMWAWFTNHGSNVTGYREGDEFKK